MPGQTKDLTLALKVVRYASGHKQFTAPRVEDLIWRGLSKVGSLADTQHPQKADEGERVYFLNDWKKLREGVRLQMCSYVPGQLTKTLRPDLSGTSVDVKNVKIVDDDGNKLEPLTVMHAHLFGDVVIVEQRRGAGGVSKLGTVLTALIRRWVDKSHPSIHLENAVSADLIKAIKAGDGATGFRVRLVHPTVHDDHRYSASMTSLFRAASGTKKLGVEFTADGTYSSAAVKEVITEAEDDDSLEGLAIQLANGNTVTLSEHRIRKPYKVQVDDSGYPISPDVVSSMRDYLTYLRRPGDGQTLTKSGSLAAVVQRKK